MKRDDIGDRIKSDYEHRTRFLLPRRTYTILRIDGKAFHTYTRSCARPFDLQLMSDMDATATALCEQSEGASIAYVQSDEISLLLTDFASPQSEAWFDGNVQKLASISASIATAHFNIARAKRARDASLAYFDSRAFTIPDPVEVYNYFVWRQQDAVSNSISMAAQSCIPHQELQGKSGDEMQEMMFQRSGINWNDYPAGCKRGRCVVRASVKRDIEYVDKRTGQRHTAENVTRYRWQLVDPPIFTRDPGWLEQYIPKPSS